MQQQPLLVFSHLRWGFVHQRPQHLLTRLASHWRVIFIEEPVRVAPGEERLEERLTDEGMTLLVPHTAVESFGFHDDQLAALEAQVGDWLRRERIADALVWLYTPMALPLVKLVTPQLLVYDCMDELSAFLGAPRQLRQRESALLRSADVVFTGGPSLYEAKRRQHPNVLCVPSAVDAQHFEQAARPQGLQQHSQYAPSPRLGFFGVIDERLDIGLVTQLADSHPEWQIDMIGPVVKIDPASLPQRDNLRWLGMQPYARLPELMAPWDLCLMPFALNEATRFISPTKTLEYLAAGKAVVSTAIRDVSVLYGEVVRIGDDAAAFVQACEAELARTPAQRERHRERAAAVVAAYSWDASAGLVAQTMNDALARGRSHALDPMQEPGDGVLALAAGTDR